MVVRCAVIFGLLGLFQATLGPLIPLVRDREHLSAATAGLLVTGFFAGSLVSTAVGGVISDRLARGPLHLVSAGLLLVGVVGLAIPAGWPFPLLAVAVAGLGFGGLVLIVNTAMAARGLTHVNLVNGIYGLGAAAGPALISVTHGGVFFAVLAVGILVFLPPRVRAATAPAEAGKLRPGATLFLFCGMLFCYAGIETALSSWEAVNLRAHGYAPDTAAALTSLFWLGLAAGRLLVPVVTKAWSASRIIALALVASFGGLALLGAAASAPVGFFVLGVLAGPIFPTTLAWIASTLPQPRRVNAAALTIAMLGNATIPTLIGFGMQSTSDLALPLFVAVAVSGCLVITMILRRRTRLVHEV